MAGNKKTVRKILSAALALVVTAALLLTPALPTSPVFAEDDLSALKQKQSEYAAQKQANDAKLGQLRQDKSNKEAYKSALDSQISTLQNQIDTYNQQISVLDDSITAAQQQIVDKQKNIAADTQKLKERLRALYMSGGASNLEILLSADSVTDLADKSEALQMVTQHDTALINTLKEEMASVKKQKEVIEQNRKDATNAKTALAGKQDELNSLASEAQTVLNEMSSQEGSLQSQSAALAQKESDASAAIDQWYANYQASQQRQQVQQAQQQAAASGGSGTSSSSGGGSAIGSGSMCWPVPSSQTITTHFGDLDEVHSHPHKGLDIAASYGAPIVAADSGTVVFAAEDNSGFGIHVIIDHGNGIMTIYGHMSSLTCSSGQTVAKGQQIGCVGSTGFSTGNHCHFQVEVNGTAVDPLGYL